MPRRWVLLVSEDPAVLGDMEAALKDTGLHVTTSPNAVHGAAQARDLRPALIVSDVEFGADRPAGIPFLLVGKTIDPGLLKAQALELSKPPAPPPPPVEAVAAPAPRAAPPLKRWLLIVGNDPATPAIVEMAVLGMGLETATAGDAQQAAVQAGTLKPELIICDLDLPGFADGGAVLREFRRNPDMSALPFIFINGAGADEALSHLLLADSTVRFARKPLDLDKIKALIVRQMTGEEAPEPAPEPAVAVDGGRGTVLVLDEDPVARGVLDGALADLGLAMSLVEPSQALRSAYDLKPALIVSDLRSPGAVELLTEMRLDALLLAVPFLFIADVPVEKAMAMLPWGDQTVRFAKKPLDLHKLKALITELTGRADAGAA